MWNKKKLQITYNLKNRSSSIKSSRTRIATTQDRYYKKTLETEREEVMHSEPNQILSPRHQKYQKLDTNENRSEDHQHAKQNIRRIEAINRVFGPKKRSEKDRTRETSSRSNKQKDYKGFIKGTQQGKINQLIFETRKKKFSLHKENKVVDNTED